MDWLDDIPGMRDLQWEDQPKLPRRSLLTLSGSVIVADNPARGSTDITFTGASPAGTTVTYTLPQAVINTLDPDPEDMGGHPLDVVHMMRLSPSAHSTIHSLAPHAQPRIALVNIGTANISLPHESVTGWDVGRFVCPGQTTFVLAGGQMAMLVRDPVANRWRIVQ
jgi:hypothetical protein